jgi:hypothetical protein
MSRREKVGKKPDFMERFKTCFNGRQWTNDEWLRQEYRRVRRGRRRSSDSRFGYCRGVAWRCNFWHHQGYSRAHTAILYLPHGFLHSGYCYAVAIPSMLFATSMFIYNSYRLLACWKMESTKQHEMAQHYIEQVLGLTTIQETKYTPTLL